MDFLNCDIWCICLDGEDDRYKLSLNEFKKVGLDNKVKYYRPKRHPLGGRVGCWTSHLHCMQESLKKDQPYILIFEDDVKFNDDYEKKIPAIKYFLDNEPDWDILRLGAIIDGFMEPSKSTPEIWKIYGVCLHAIFYKTSFIGKMMSNNIFKNPSKTHLAIDELFKDLAYNKTINDYCLTDTICLQRNQQISSIDTFNIFDDMVSIKNSQYYESLQDLNNKMKWQVRWMPLNIQILFNPFIYLRWRNSIILIILIIIIILCIISVLINKN